MKLIVETLIGALIEGAILFVLDRRLGVRIYRRFHDMTSGTPLPKEVDRGFIYGRKADGRFATAVLVSLLQSGTAFWLHIGNPFYAVLAMVIEIPGLMVGFYVGPVFSRIWDRRKPLLDVVDKLEEGTTSVGDEVRRVADAAREHLHIVRDVPTSPATTPEAATPSLRAEDPKPVVEAAEDPRAALDRFTQGRRGGDASRGK